MIKSIWKPKYLNKNKKRIIDNFFEIEIKELLEMKYHNCKVIFTCDICNSNDIHSSSSSSLLRSKYNNINSQTCRSCRSKISEYEIRKTYIPFIEIERRLYDENYKMISTEEEYMESDNRSQFRIKVICGGNHIHHITWNNWNKGRRCRKCYEDNKFNKAIKYKEGFELYMFDVLRLTEISYRKHKLIIDPNNLRSLDHHLDHIFSKYEGFKYGINPEIISSPINLKIVKSEYNLTKGKRSDITKKVLLEKYNKYTDKAI